MANTDAPPVNPVAIDIRLFLVTITISMAVAFGVGVGMGPAAPAGRDAWHQSMEERVVRSVEAQSNKLQNASETEEHQAAGQHLLVDIKGVDSDFLDSEERLSKAMVETVIAGGLTMLSYHCHKLHPSGVSCVGVLLESHISFHTWPEDGVITLDLFTCGANPLMPVIPKIKELFGVGENTETHWSHELRGFRHENDRSSAYYLDTDNDLSLWVLSPLDMHIKEEIVSTKSPYQQIDIWDVVEVDNTPSHQDALKHNLQPGDPRWLTHELVTPDRLLFLDGVLQSLTSSDREYHEALVHPGMFAHPKPEYVGILGGGEGGTLREVLKHKTVKEATMVEIDEYLVNICREHLPQMSDCSNLEGRAKNCFDDELTNLVYADGRQWFVDRFGPTPTTKADHKFDVLIVDALDPEDPSDISTNMYNDNVFVQSLVNSLSDDGVLVIQVGTAPNIHDPKADVGVFKQREVMFNLIESIPDVKVMLVYEEAHCGFSEPHSFLVVGKSADLRTRWYAESDVVDYEIYERIVLDLNEPIAPLAHFDGATQHSYHVPPKAWETVYCRREPIPFECAYLHLDMDMELHDYVFDDEVASSFRLEKYEDGENEEDDDENNESVTSVFATKDIPKGSYILPGHLASSYIITDKTMQALQTTASVEGTGRVHVIEDLLSYIKDHGHKSNADGLGLSYVEVGASSLIRHTFDETKVNVGRWIPSHPSGARPKFSPVYERHRHSFDVFLVATQFIPKGSELLRSTTLWAE